MLGKCIPLSLMLFFGCAMQMDSYEEKQDRSDSAIKAEWIWPQGDFNAVLGLEISDEILDSVSAYNTVNRNINRDWYHFWNVSDAGPTEIEKSLLEAQKELEENTPIRFKFFKTPEEVGNRRYYDFISTESFMNIPMPPKVKAEYNGTLGFTTGLATYAPHLYVGPEGLFFRNDGPLILATQPSIFKHELGHGLGLNHTQNRIDRDEHINVHSAFIHEDAQDQFVKQSSDLTNDIGPYDVKSVMHYSSLQGRKYAECGTMTLKGAPTNCGPEAVGHFLSNSKSYSAWNFVTLSAMYCEPQFCGDNCASAERCAEPKVAKNLMRFRRWERTGETKLPEEDAVCGDGFVDMGEECDDDYNCVIPGCTFGECRDEIVNGDEECDEGGINTKSCNKDCTFSECGDGIHNRKANESCDAGPDGSADCNINCTPSVCGDGIHNTLAKEICDDGRQTRYCEKNCKEPVCGDGISNLAAGEDCDDGYQTATCEANCKAPRCGDGILNSEAGEECELGDVNCNPNCRVETPSNFGCNSGGGSSPFGLVWLISLTALFFRKRNDKNIFN